VVCNMLHAIACVFVVARALSNDSAPTSNKVLLPLSTGAACLVSRHYQFRSNNPSFIHSSPALPQGWKPIRVLLYRQ
jgi:hypothetical protein